MKKTLDAKIEDKHIVWGVSNDSHNSSITNADCYPLVNTIAQGVGDGYRIGEKLTPKYLKVTVRVALDYNYMANNGGTGVDLSPLQCRVIAFTQSDVKVGSSSSPLDTAHLLRTGVGASAYTGSWVDNLVPINTDKFKVLKDKLIKLVPMTNQPSDAQGIFPNSFTQFTFKVKCPKYFKYDITTGDWPNNFAPWICLGWSAPGSGPTYTLQTPVHMDVISHFVYEDA